ncbi:MAG: Hsp20/alpha crystallin family protein [Planctomycetota bacterium]|jgi:HSP20 family protein
MVFQEMVPWKNRRRNVGIRPSEESYPLSTLQRRMNRMFDDFFGDFGDFSLSPLRALTRGTNGFMPRMDIAETDTDITLCAELAGMDEKDVEITVHDDVLTITGEKKSAREEKEGERFLTERSYGSFSRSIALPAEVDQDKIDASFKKGVLTVKLPKVPVEETKAKKIDIKGE